VECEPDFVCGDGCWQKGCMVDGRALAAGWPQRPERPSFRATPSSMNPSPFVEVFDVVVVCGVDGATRRPPRLSIPSPRMTDRPSARSSERSGRPAENRRVLHLTTVSYQPSPSAPSAPSTPSTPMAQSETSSLRKRSTHSNSTIRGLHPLKTSNDHALTII